MAVIEYTANPTAARLHLDQQHEIFGAVGPWGSGKSTVAIWDLFLHCERNPTCDALVVRDTYTALKDSCVNQFLRHFGDLGTIQWGPPPTFTWNHEGRHGRMKGKVLFRSAEDPRDVQKFLSVEVGYAWLEEVCPGISAAGTRNQGLPPEIFAGVFARIRQAGIPRRMILTSAPPPSAKHWFHTLFYDKKPISEEGMSEETAQEIVSRLALYHFSPDENSAHLPAGYYSSVAAMLKTPDQVARFVYGHVGASYAGNPVYPGYSDELHRDIALLPLPGPLLRGWDGGLTPACVWAQVTPAGRLLILGELQGEDVAIELFADAAKTYGNQLFGPRAYRDFGDKTLGTTDQGSGRSAIDYLRDKGIILRPVSNDPDARIQAVRGWLAKLGSDGALLRIHPRCETLIEGFRGAYRFHEVGGVATDRPEKNEYSHLHDCLQYICLGLSIGSQAHEKLPPIPARKIDTLGRFGAPASVLHSLGTKRRTHRGAY